MTDSLLPHYLQGDITQEIVVEDLGDTDEHGEIDALSFEHLVYVAAVAVDGLCKPHHRAALRLQLRTYHPAYMYLLRVCGHKKNRELNCLCGGSAKPKLQQESPRFLVSVSPFFCSLLKFADFHTQRKAKTLYNKYVTKSILSYSLLRFLLFIH